MREGVVMALPSLLCLFVLSYAAVVQQLYASSLDVCLYRKRLGSSRQLGKGKAKAKGRGADAESGKRSKRRTGPSSDLFFAPEFLPPCPWGNLEYWYRFEFRTGQVLEGRSDDNEVITTVKYNGIDVPITLHISCSDDFDRTVAGTSYYGQKGGPVYGQHPPLRTYTVVKYERDGSCDVKKVCGDPIPPPSPESTPKPTLRPTRKLPPTVTVTRIPTHLAPPASTTTTAPTTNPVPLTSPVPTQVPIAPPAAVPTKEPSPLTIQSDPTSKPTIDPCDCPREGEGEFKYHRLRFRYFLAGVCERMSRSTIGNFESAIKTTLEQAFQLRCSTQDIIVRDVNVPFDKQQVDCPEMPSLSLDFKDRQLQTQNGVNGDGTVDVELNPVPPSVKTSTILTDSASANQGRRMRRGLQLDRDAIRSEECVITPSFIDNLLETGDPYFDEVTEVKVDVTEVLYFQSARFEIVIGRKILASFLS